MKYLNFDGLSHFLSKLRGVFSVVGHTHTKSEITDYVVDSAMSSTSTNPVQNKVVNTALSGKVSTSRKINGKALTADITLSAADVGAAAASHTHDSIVSPDCLALTWSGDHMLSSTDRPNQKLHFGESWLYRNDPNGYHIIYDTGNLAMYLDGTTLHITKTI